MIGDNGKIPWRLSEDQKRFKELTSGHTVLMGRKTFDSLPQRFKPLPNRHSVVITRSPESLREYPQVVVFSSVDEWYKSICEKSSDEICWVIGGGEIYKETLKYWDEIDLTIVPGKHGGDAFMPHFEDHFEVTRSQKGEECTFYRYVRKR